jgi:hypothetical protein
MLSSALGTLTRALGAHLRGRADPGHREPAFAVISIVERAGRKNGPEVAEHRHRRDCHECQARQTPVESRRRPHTSSSASSACPCSFCDWNFGTCHGPPCGREQVHRAQVHVVHRTASATTVSATASRSKSAEPRSRGLQWASAGRVTRREAALPGLPGRKHRCETIRKCTTSPNVKGRSTGHAAQLRSTMPTITPTVPESMCRKRCTIDA